MPPAGSRSLLLLLFALSAARLDAAEPGACPRGHMKPFGHQVRRWLRVESRYDPVGPEEFYAQYVRPSRPVVLRGAIKDWPAVQRWPNLTYLGELAGDRMMSAHWHRVHDEHEYLRWHHVARVVGMKEYIARMERENIYMDTPPTPPLLGEMLWPAAVNCEYYIRRMRAPSFFFNTGRSSTDIHIDGCETLFFQIAGRRLWLMSPPDNASLMYSGYEHFPPHTGISAVNQRSVNLTAYPRLAQVALYATVVHAGDLIYLPEAWYHNVVAHGNPNLATTIFFDASDCEKKIPIPGDALYAKTCARHRDIFLPPTVQCPAPASMPPGATWLDVARRYGDVNPKLRPPEDEFGSVSRSREQVAAVMKTGLWRKALADGSRLPRMALDAEFEPLLAALPNASRSVLQLGLDFLAPRLDDIPALAAHLQRFAVAREALSLMLVVPHALVTGGRPAAVTEWLDEAAARFRPYAAAGPPDLVLLEAPPCVPAAPTDQDCSRAAGGDLGAALLGTWRALEARRAAGAVRHLGLKDVSAAELRALSAEAQAPVAVVSVRLDPLFRQAAVRREMARLGTKPMVHSVTGSGWVRDGVAASNPLFEQTDALNPIFEDTASVPGVVYQWALLKGFFVVPERTARPAVAEISAEALIDMATGYFNRALPNAVDGMRLGKKQETAATPLNVKH